MYKRQIGWRVNILSFVFKGFGVNLKPSFFVMCVLLVLLGRGGELCILILSVTLHEGAHILTAALFGARAESVTVTPIGQQATIQGLERISFFRRMLVVMAGPGVNAALWLSLIHIFAALYCIF